MMTKTFRGGIHPRQKKEATVDRRTRTIEPPEEIILPLSQHTGSPNVALCSVGDKVTVGQTVAGSKAYISAPVHSPVSGKIKAIKDHFNPVYGRTPAFVIENDRRYERFPSEKNEKAELLPAEEIIKAVKEAGIVGLGGAAFPAHVKLSIPEGKRIDTLIINGAECEPYLTSDHRLMLEKTAEILKGANLLARASGAGRIVFAVEENKMNALFALDKIIKDMKGRLSGVPIGSVALKTKYPQGGEKQIIKTVLAREVPPGRLPMDVGALVQNVSTCFAVYEALYKGKPLVERYVTFTGDALREPGNFLVKLGTTIRHIADKCGGFREKPAKVIAGGPMMGISQFTLDSPVIKGTGGVLFLTAGSAGVFEEHPCIRCAKCIDICPMNMLPTEIMRMVKHNRWHLLPGLNPSDCMECGSCAYVCPSRIPLVQYIKLAKFEERKRK